MSMEFTNNNNNLKKSFITLESDFSNMSDPNVVIEPSDNK